MSRRAAFLALVGVAILAAAAASDDVGSGPRKTVYPERFPEGEGQAIAARSCLICHAATLVTQQAKDSTAWEKTLGTMEKWGVKLSRAEHDSLRAYLLVHFGPTKKP